MSPDLKYLLFSVILTFVQMLIAVTFANFALGLPTLAGNREGLSDLPGIGGRANAPISTCSRTSCCSRCSC
jgi:uncharacterized MAPEG superfamily protein